MSQTLKLTDYETATEETPESYAFDRRYADRHEVSGRVTVQRRDHTATAYRHPICSLQLRNMGCGGMAAVSDVALAPNESVAVFFPSHGVDQGLDLHGRVIRCLPANGGYQVAIAFDTDRAA